TPTRAGTCAHGDEVTRHTRQLFTGHGTFHSPCRILHVTTCFRKLRLKLRTHIGATIRNGFTSQGRLAHAARNLAPPQRQTHRRHRHPHPAARCGTHASGPLAQVLVLHADTEHRKPHAFVHALHRGK